MSREVGVRGVGADCGRARASLPALDMVDRETERVGRLERSRADLASVCDAIFALYSAGPSIGTVGAEVVELAVQAEELLPDNPEQAEAAIRRARELLAWLGEPAA